MGRDAEGAGSGTGRILMARPPQRPNDGETNGHGRVTAATAVYRRAPVVRASFLKCRARRCRHRLAEAGWLVRSFAPSYAESNGDKGPTRWTVLCGLGARGNTDARRGAERRATAQRGSSRVPGCRADIRGAGLELTWCAVPSAVLASRSPSAPGPPPPRLLCYKHTRAHGGETRARPERRGNTRGEAGLAEERSRGRGAGLSAQAACRAALRSFVASPDVSPRHWHPQANLR